MSVYLSTFLLFVHPSVHLSVYLSISLPFTCPSVRLSVCVFFLIFFLSLSHLEFLILIESLSFYSFRNLRRERELFLVPKNSCREVLGNPFHENFRNCRDMTGKIMMLDKVSKKYYLFINFNVLKIKTHKNKNVLISYRNKLVKYIFGNFRICNH